MKSGAKWPILPCLVGNKVQMRFWTQDKRMKNKCKYLTNTWTFLWWSWMIVLSNQNSKPTSNHLVNLINKSLSMIVCKEMLKRKLIRNLSCCLKSMMTQWITKDPSFSTILGCLMKSWKIKLGLIWTPRLRKVGGLSKARIWGPQYLTWTQISIQMK